MKWLFYCLTMKHFLYLLIILSIHSACNRGNSIKASADVDSSYVPLKPKGMMDQIRFADSAALIYFNQPGNPRFFKVTQLRNLDVLKELMTEVNGAHVRGVENCQTLGKFYFYGKGDIVDVVYFTNADSCMTFSYIKNGEKYFSRMGLFSKHLIDSLKTASYTP